MDANDKELRTEFLSVVEQEFLRNLGDVAKNSDVRGLANEWADAIWQSAVAGTNPQDGIVSMLVDAFDLLDDARSAVNRLTEPGMKEFARDQWEWQMNCLGNQSDPKGYLLPPILDPIAPVTVGGKGTKAWSIHHELLDQVCYRYVRSRLPRCERFERMLMDASLYTEISGTAIGVAEKLPRWMKSTFPPFRWGTGATTTLLIGGLWGLVQIAIAIGIGFSVAEKQSGGFGLLAGLATYLGFALFRFIGTYWQIQGFAMQMELLGGMNAVFKDFRNRLPDQYLWQRLLDSGAQGAVWPSGVVTILEFRLNGRPAIG